MTSHATCPYRSVPDDQRWDRAFAGGQASSLQLYAQRTPKFTFDKTQAVATFGSCFAQHISRHLTQRGYNFLRAEYDDSLSPDENASRGNSSFSARYGNIYSASHFEQLFRRAFGLWDSIDRVWEKNGRYWDPLRPSVDAEGFADVRSLDAARRTHLAAVRAVFEKAEVLILTLGLTEGWVNTADGTAYPICPGCGFGTFDPAQHAFKNYTVDEVTGSLNRVLDELAAINPRLKVILTVSPVPLAATMEQHHVLTSTVYSKSVLRVAAESVANARSNVDYFASYEIVNWGRDMSSYFEGDLRTVAEDGIDHVMRSFFRLYCGDDLPPVADKIPSTWCDEELHLGPQENPVTAPVSPQATSSDGPQELTKPRRSDLLHPNPFTVWKPLPNSIVVFNRKVDGRGYYNARDIADYPGDKFRRICVVGSSFVADFTHKIEDTICGVLQKRFKANGMEDVVIYNCGLSGSISSQDLSNLVHDVADFDPALVVVLTGTNDVPNALRSDPRPGHPRQYFAFEKAIERFLAKDNREESVGEFQALRTKAGYGQTEWFDALTSLYRRNIEKMSQFARGARIPCLLVNPPIKEGYRLDANRYGAKISVSKLSQLIEVDAYMRSRFFAEVLAGWHQPNVLSSLDLTNIFDDGPDSYFVDSKHLTPAGYEVAGDRVFEHMLNAFPDVLLN